ncbi:uncharacterized protein EURHEDRAFT_288849 [Aspergillus ruber CBS 135680]|uniref:Uncharacterized protein n=1 Tax=Aspergillus ruber (strain CBS 135680) TaxID=1388766 RepID=A0A017S0W2_ASPRC|nr:uncharacterized protein EURHEDRAFT_288849 [Aspergillus ruber CBS 135680]EYE90547.1 hypothetical protein EURHEDRAFT_288849 [Aspergillus ruber CBS 135680]
MQVASSVFYFLFLVVFRRQVFNFYLLTFEIYVRLPFAFIIGVFPLVQLPTAIYHQYLLVSFFFFPLVFKIAIGPSTTHLYNFLFELHRRLSAFWDVFGRRIAWRVLYFVY